jgi:hypothetical protein
MIVFTARGFDTYALALQTLWSVRDMYWDIMWTWCRHHLCAVCLPYALNDERMRIRRRQWPEAENPHMPWLQIFLSSNENVGLTPHAYVPWPDVSEQTLAPLRRRAYGWLRRLRLRPARQALLAGLWGNQDLAQMVLAHVGW